MCYMIFWNTLQSDSHTQGQDWVLNQCQVLCIFIRIDSMIGNLAWRYFYTFKFWQIQEVKEESNTDCTCMCMCIYEYIVCRGK